jgi:hypothetical protein
MMKTYMILHYGFEKPTPEEMELWNQWFESISEIQVYRGHFPAGKEISKSGITDLPFTAESITGFTMIKAENFDEAESIAKKCPFVNSTRVYEIRSG